MVSNRPPLDAIAKSPKPIASNRNPGHLVWVSLASVAIGMSQLHPIVQEREPD
jgi:hypothetical protein